MANLGGRPTVYTPELAERICKAVGSCTLGLKEICEDNPDFPCRDTINEWRYDHPRFSDMYRVAKQMQADLLAEEILEVSDKATNDWMERNDPDNPGWIVNGEAIARSKLRVDTRKWIACKLLPKVYGDKKEVESNTKVEFVNPADALKQLE